MSSVIVEERVDSCAYDFPARFATATADGRIYVAYYNADHDITVACRESVDTGWARAVLPSRANWDTHRAIVLAVDTKGRLHLSGNMHADPLVYFRTTEPLNIDSFELVRPMVNKEEEARATYPRFLSDANDDLVFMYRLGGSGNGITIVNRHRADTDTFERVSDKPLFDGLNEMSAYHSGPVRGPDGRYHLFWVWRNTPHCETNHDLSYAVSDDLVHWRPYHGNPTEAPITPLTDQFVVDPVPPAGGIINGGHTSVFDPSGKPVIVYHKYDAAGNNQVYVARQEPDGWRSHVVSAWDHRWEFTGPGSITFEIRLGQPNFDGNRLIVPYWHVERGHGEIHVDASSLEPTEDRLIDAPQSPYPEHLQRPQSDGMTVQWLPASSTSDGTAAFRWEVGGKRRFYDPPDPPIPAGDLMFYCG